MVTIISRDNYLAKVMQAKGPGPGDGNRHAKWPKHAQPVHPEGRTDHYEMARQGRKSQ